MRNAKVFVVSLIGLFFLCAAGIAQVTTGSILGTVHDSSGAVVPNATVTITDTGKGTAPSSKPTMKASTTFPSSSPEPTTSLSRCRASSAASRATSLLDIDQKARVDFALETRRSDARPFRSTPPRPSSASTAPSWAKWSARQQVENLPLNGRNFASLVYLVPGVTSGQAGENLSGSSSFNPRAASNFNSLGSQANTNACLVDGIVDNEWTFNTVMVQPSVESIAEFKVLTGSYSADFGGGAGVVSVSTRSGSNGLHGELFAYLRNSAVDARNYFARVGSSVQKPALRRGQFGGAVARRDHEGQALLLRRLLRTALAERHRQPEQRSHRGRAHRRLQRLHQHQRAR